MMGHRVSHSKRRTNHGFKPNLQKKTFVLDGKKVSVKLCTNCIKLYKYIDRKKKEELAAKESAAEAQVSPVTA
jgi:ribosomal protein L28